MSEKMGRISGEGEAYQVQGPAHRGWLTLENENGDAKKCRVGDFEFDADLPEFAEGEVFMNDEGKAVDAEGDPIAQDEEAEEGEDDEDKEAKPMYALQRRKAEGAYEVVDLGDKRKSLCNPDWVPELRDYAGDPDGAIAYVEKELGLDAGFLAEKYAHLNAGQKRMNAGNRLRSHRVKEAMYQTVADDLGLELDEVLALAGRVGKGAVTEKKIRAIHTADTTEAEKTEPAEA